jgi:hypothetical protein
MPRTACANQPALRFGWRDRTGGPIALVIIRSLYWHMTAPDQCCINVKKLLSIRRRPHMTQLRRWATRFAVVHNAAFLGRCDIGCDPRLRGAS